MDMTAGSIPRLLISFSFPLMQGSLLQETYHTFDAAIVGNYIGSGALAAVGMSMAVNSTVAGFFMGLSNGAAVLVARFFGARDRASLNKTVHTAIFLAALMGVVLSAAGVLVTPWLLRAIHTPESVFVEASVYFRITFSGTAALTVYNMGTAILNALGESKKPLMFLVVSVVINVVLDLVFVAGIGWGVAGAAVAVTVVLLLLNVRLLRVFTADPEVLDRVLSGVILLALYRRSDWSRF
jgi:Na+-driven multidrug efflux pump